MDAVVKLFKTEATEPAGKAPRPAKSPAEASASAPPTRKGTAGKAAKPVAKVPAKIPARPAETAVPLATKAAPAAITTLPVAAEAVLPRPSRDEAEAAVRTLLAYIGEDVGREGLIDTPRRVVRAYEELFSGYGTDPEQLLERTFGEIGTFDDFVLLRDIPFHSHCEHHMVPFIGKAHIAYFPVERVVGLSKIARVVDTYARRLQTQEHLTSQIVTALESALRPRGVAVMLEAEHMCMAMRGIQKPGVSTLTSQFTGVFREQPAEQVRFITLLRGGKS